MPTGTTGDFAAGVVHQIRGRREIDTHAAGAAPATDAAVVTRDALAAVAASAAYNFDAGADGVHTGRKVMATAPVLGPLINSVSLQIESICLDVLRARCP